jgi:hypothetical protein
MEVQAAKKAGADASKARGDSRASLSRKLTISRESLQYVQDRCVAMYCSSGACVRRVWPRITL